jgi:hypothetical protein
MKVTIRPAERPGDPPPTPRQVERSLAKMRAEADLVREENARRVAEEHRILSAPELRAAFESGVDAAAQVLESNHQVYEARLIRRTLIGRKL